MKIYFRHSPNYGWSHLLQSYKKIVNKQSVVLEIGASATPNTRELAKYVHQVIGVEYYQSRLPSNYRNITYKLGDWQKLTSIIQRNSIDCVVSSHCLEHIPDDQKALNQLYQIMKPNAVALLTTPNRLRLSRRLIEIFTGPRHFPHWEHVREYSYQDLVNLISKTKFTKYRITPVVFGLYAPPHFVLFSTVVPNIFKNYANYWEVSLIK